MKEQYNDSIQNRFTAYLVAAVVHRRIRYMEQKRKRIDHERILMDLLEKNHLDFDTQFHAYVSERENAVVRDWAQFREILDLLGSRKLVRAVERLKEREKTLLFARVCGELSFTEIAEMLDINPKQAEMAYYYVVRKLRKELEVWMRHGQ